MEQLINQILTHKEAAALPSLLESGGLPALVSGLSPVHRANLAAALYNKIQMPLFVLCADDTAAEGRKDIAPVQVLFDEETVHFPDLIQVLAPFSGRKAVYQYLPAAFSQFRSDSLQLGDRQRLKFGLRQAIVTVGVRFFKRHAVACYSPARMYPFTQESVSIGL
jgi:hypothetical protein